MLLSKILNIWFPQSCVWNRRRRQAALSPAEVNRCWWASLAAVHASESDHPYLTCFLFPKPLRSAPKSPFCQKCVSKMCVNNVCQKCVCQKCLSKMFVNSVPYFDWLIRFIDSIHYFDWSMLLPLPWPLRLFDVNKSHKTFIFTYSQRTSTTTSPSLAYC